MRNVPILLAAMLALSACGKSSAPTQKTYTLFTTAQKEPPGGVTAKLTVPGNWKEEVDAMGSPSFTLPDVEQVLPQMSLVAIPCRAEGDCMERAISMQYDAADLAEAKREDLGGGRVFITQDTSKGTRRVHARLFAPHPASKTMVMCVVMLLEKAGDKLPDIRKVCESLTL